MPPNPLEIETQVDVVVVRPLGDIDLNSADALREACFAAVDNDSPGLVIDLSRAGYVDSAGIGALFSVAQRLDDHRQHLALALPADAHLRRVLGIVAIDTVAWVEETVDAAVARLRG